MPDMPSTDEMIAEFSGGNQSESPASESAPTEQVTPPSPTEGSAPQIFEYTANGKTVKEPLETVLKRASQGYNYAQHMADLKKRSEDIEQRYSRAVELEEKYGEIDKFAKENPEWNDHLHKTWETRFDVTGGSGGQPETQQGGIPSQLLTEFNELKSFVENIKAERADQAYEASVNRVKEAHPDIDFGHTDPDTGKTLEQQVLDYAQENNIGRFEPAFKAFYSDRLIEQARLQGKEQLAGDLQRRTKAGLLGTSQAPAKSQSEWEYPSNYKNMSMDQLHNWIVDKYAR